MAPRVFGDRRDAGRELASLLDRYADRDDVLVLGLPRGGVPVAFEIALYLRAPLDVFGVRKLGVPGHEELAFGAIATGGIRYVDRDLASQLGIDDDVIREITQREELELERRESRLRHGLPPLNVAGRTVVLVDDGLATGSTMRAAVDALRTRSPAKIVVAVPVASPDVCDLFSVLADESYCLYTPDPMLAVGMWYEDFSQTSDEEVFELLQAVRDRVAGAIQR